MLFLFIYNNIVTIRHLSSSIELTNIHVRQNYTNLDYIAFLLYTNKNLIVEILYDLNTWAIFVIIIYYI